MTCKFSFYLGVIILRTGMKKTVLMLMALLLLSASFIVPAFADDDDEYEYRHHDDDDDDDDDEYEYHRDDDDNDDDDDDDEHEYYEHEDDDEEYEDDKYESYVPVQVVQPVVQSDTFVWDRTTLPLPIVAGSYQPLTLQMTKAGDPQSKLDISLLYHEQATLTPLNDTAGKLGAEVLWHPQYQIIEVKGNDNQLLFKLNKAICYENGKKLPMTVPTLLINGTVYVPADVLLDGLGWNATQDNNLNQWALERR